MTKLVRIKLKDMTPLHLGLGRDSYDVSASVLQSDMLSAALASVRAMHGKGTSTEGFLNNFALSSAFPYDGDEYFLPRMKGQLPIRVRGQEEKDYRKKLKKLSYISFEEWKRLAKGETVDVDDNQLHGMFLLSQPVADYAPPMTHVTTERVAVSRTGDKDAMPFMFDWTFFRHAGTVNTASGKEITVKEAGLYCLLAADNATTEEVVSLFKELGELGIGSDKSVGGGHFTVDTGTVEIPALDTGRQIILSTYIPTKSELDAIELQKSNYQLVHRGGFMAGSSDEGLRHLRKKTVYMFDTGSVLAIKEPLQGRIVNVAPEWNNSDMHPVFRSGKPLTVHIS